MAFLVKNYTTDKKRELIDDINSDNNISPPCYQIISTGDNTLTFNFENELTTEENDYLDSFLLSWVPPEDIVELDGVDDQADASINTLWSSQKIINTIEEEFIGWKDLRTSFHVDTSKKSTSAMYQEMGNTGFYAYVFPRNKHASTTYQIESDYKPSGEMYLHLHWTTDGTETDSVKWEIKYTIAKGYNQAEGSELFNPIHTIYMEQNASGTAWKHMVVESPVLDITNAETNAMILVTLTRIANETSDNKDDIYALQMDLHYQTDRHSIPDRVPSFY